MFKLTFIFIFVFLPYIMLLAQQESPALEKANNLIKEKNYTEAIKVYKDLLVKEPDNSMLWFYIGSAEYSLKNYDNAIKAYSEAAKGLKGPVVRYNLAGVYALTGNKEMVFKFLQEAADKGFGQHQLLATDDDFADFRNENKFKKILEQVRINGTPCLSKDEYQQFNFWVGEWNVFNQQGKETGRSVIEKINNGCTIVENWYGKSGYQGKSFNYFDSTDNNWHQFWIDQNADKIIFTGKLVGKDMVFYSYDHTKDKEGPFLRRLTFFNLGENKVRQFSEQSFDEGKSWKTEYDFIYNRKNAAE